MSFADATLTEKYKRLGFKPEGFGMELQIGSVKLSAVEHPWKGVVIFFTELASRTACQTEIAMPNVASLEQIAGIIYSNFKSSFEENAATCKRYFQEIDVEPFPYDPAKLLG